MKKLLTVLIVLAFPAFAATPVVGKTDAGDALTTAEGMTLYTFDHDKEGLSKCEGGCLKQWPAAKVEASDTASGDFTILERADGSKQWRYKNMPLYRWVLDLEPGQATGDGVGGVWHVAKP
ncbi:MAG: hypothetical protein WAX89_02470 [Alphaproteobacteria bacterium]